MRILLLDNYDSFTFNIVERLRQLGYSEIDRRFNNAIEPHEALAYDAIILSPGPATPAESGCLCALIEHVYTQRPLLGICLGHQAIAQVMGAPLINLTKPYHGFRSTLHVLEKNNSWLQALNQKPIGLYHSWVVGENPFPNTLAITARSTEGHIMAIEHRQHPVYGVQFHPESYMTPDGDALFNGFLNEVALSMKAN
jgi:anthranilate synthase component 2